MCVCLCLPACAAALAAPRTPMTQPSPLATHAAAARGEPIAPSPDDAPPELFVRCEDPANCPDAVGMLIVHALPDAEPERCTVTLIERDRVLTASHCLPPDQRRAGASCARVWVSFPDTSRSAAELIACEQVVAASEVVSDDALSQEHAILQLSRRSARAALAVDPAPIEPGSIVTVASVTPHAVYGCTHALSTRLCRVIDSTPAENALGSAAANVGWLASCPIARGNSGSPVLDYHGRIRAIVHGGTSLSAAFGVTSAISK